jgi:hypothetical protein
MLRWMGMFVSAGFGGWGWAGRIIFKRKDVHDLASLSPPHLGSGAPLIRWCTCSSSSSLPVGGGG